jgi:hypothetical protein
MKKTNYQNPSPDEINLIDLIKLLWNKKMIIFKSVIFFSFIGLFIAVTSEEEYNSYSTMIQQSTGGGKAMSGGISDLAAIAGFNLGSISSSSNIPIALYPRIVNSINFKKELLNSKIVVQGLKNDVSLLEYYDSIYEPGILNNIKKYILSVPKFIFSLPSKVFRFFQKKIKPDFSSSKNNLNYISQKERDYLDLLENNISIDIEELTGLITINGKMSNAISAASLVENAQKILQKTLIKLKIQKSIEKYNFIEKQFLKAEKEFLENQDKLSDYEDSNLNISTAKANSLLNRIKTKYDISFNVYKQLIQELESQKIQVQEDTPIFTIIESASVPYERSKPQRTSIVIYWIFIGFIISSIYIFLIEIIKNVKKKF